MFVFSIKTSKKQLVSLLLCLAALAGIILLAVSWPSEPVSVTVPAPDEDARVEYLQQLGYQPGATHSEVREVLIPDEFDEVFTQYNELQKVAGMDLLPYHGKRAKVYTYRIFNHPQGSDVAAHLYVYDNKIIGGDISSTAMNGFMTGLIQL
ncbi:MAG: DUF4830 domain-containing protein [Oscillospiraceae bacterium]|nr:DUF4830 domain-containing protein [Oscillospiraceae bacterium]